MPNVKQAVDGHNKTKLSQTNTIKRRKHMQL